MIIYLERMIESFEGLTLNDFEVSPDVSPAGQTTTTYTNKTSPNTVSSKSVSIRKGAAPIKKEQENTPRLRYIACVETEDEMRSVARHYQPQMAQMQLRSTNWKGLIYTLLIVTRKFWNDNNYWNADVVNALKKFDLDYLNETENLVLRLLDFRLFVPPEEFRGTYDSLRNYY